MRVSRRFPNSPSSVTQARRYVQSQIEDAPQEVAEAVAVMTSELVTNSIRHAASDFEVGIDRQAGSIRVEVTDRGGSGLPTVMSPDPMSPSGRGLFIVEQLSDSWGVAPASDHTSKTVWFTVAVPAIR